MTDTLTREQYEQQRAIATLSELQQQHDVTPEQKVYYTAVEIQFGNKPEAKKAELMAYASEADAALEQELKDVAAFHKEMEQHPRP